MGQAVVQEVVDTTECLSGCTAECVKCTAHECCCIAMCGYFAVAAVVKGLKKAATLPFKCCCKRNVEN